MQTFRLSLLITLAIILCSSLAACTATPAATVPPTTVSITTAATTAAASPSNTPTPSKTAFATTPVSSTPAAPSDTPKETTVISPEFYETFANHFGFMPAQWDFENARSSGGAYDRPFFELFRWDMIEKQPGVFDFYQTDRYVKESQAYGLHILANIQPFAAWDQSICHGPQPTNSFNNFAESTKYKPCDMAAYANFITRLIERYDGDGADDMPGLTMPIKHWELMNEPEFQTFPIYFQGTPADYAEVLKATYETIKLADPEAYVVQGGMAGMMPESAAWWQGVFDAGGGEYIDIMNMHSIGHGEHLNIPAFKALLAENGLQDKPFWVTEVQYQQSFHTQNYSNEDFAEILARSYIFALANGVDKLFYVNLRMPPVYDTGIPFDESSALISDSGAQSALFQAHLIIAGLFGDMTAADTVTVISESVGDWYVDAGQYKFTLNGKVIYALWGSGGLPAEITGTIRIIDISGEETTAEAAAVTLTDSPIFILLD